MGLHVDPIKSCSTYFFLNIFSGLYFKAQFPICDFSPVYQEDIAAIEKWFDDNYTFYSTLWGTNLQEEVIDLQLPMAH